MPEFPEFERITSKLPFFNGGMITTVSHLTGSAGVNTITTSTGWSSANLGIYVAVIIPERVTVVQLGWYNGTATGTNVDAGIYDINGTLIISTTPTAMSGTSAWQFVNITDTSLGPGCFYLAMSGSSTTGRPAYLTPAASYIAQGLGVYQQASVGTLPANSTMTTLAVSRIPVIAAMIDGTA